MLGSVEETMNSQRTTERLRQLLDPRDEVLEAYLFGSRASGRAQEHSDIDVAVYVNEDRCRERPYGYRAELTAGLMAGLGSNAVDVVILNDAPPLLYHRVLRDGVRVLARDLKATTVREARALSRYCDFLPQLDKLDRAFRTSRLNEATRP
jgi:predicted nucleotidyltransferase